MVVGYDAMSRIVNASHAAGQDVARGTHCDAQSTAAPRARVRLPSSASSTVALAAATIQAAHARHSVAADFAAHTVASLAAVTLAASAAHVPQERSVRGITRLTLMYSLDLRTFYLIFYKSLRGDCGGVDGIRAGDCGGVDGISPGW